MVALLEWLLESSTLDPSVKVMVPQLEKIIFLLREICPPDDDIDILMVDVDDTQQHPAATAAGPTPTPNGPPSNRHN